MELKTKNYSILYINDICLDLTGQLYPQPLLKVIPLYFHPHPLDAPSHHPQPMYQRRSPCWGREAHVLGAQETCLGAGGIPKHLYFGVLHGARNGTIHKASNSKFWYTQFAF